MRINIELNQAGTERAMEIRQTIKGKTHLPMPIIDKLIYEEGLKHALTIKEVVQAEQSYRRLK